jgi:heme oxygenase
MDQEPDARVHRLLQEVHVAGLARSERLISDVATLRGISTEQARDALVALSRKPCLAEITEHIKSTVARKPHTIMAYAWVMYMALFAGGRYLRQTLYAAGDEFWQAQVRSPLPCELRANTGMPQAQTTPQGAGRPTLSRSRKPIESQLPALSFWHFNGDQDGEDIKVQFKQQYAECEGLLTSEEQEEVVEESVAIFNLMLRVVEHLDQSCGTDAVLDTFSSAHEHHHSYGHSPALPDKGGLSTLPALPKLAKTWSGRYVSYFIFLLILASGIWVGKLELFTWSIAGTTE